MRSRCPFCIRSYANAGSFDRHLSKVHPAQAPEWYDRQFLKPPVEGSRGLPEGSGGPHEGERFDIPDENESDTQSNDEDHTLGPTRFNLATTIYEGAGEPLFTTAGYDEGPESLLINPWQPFESAEEFRLSRWFLQSNVSQGQIDDFFRTIRTLKGSYSTGRGFARHLDEMSSMGGLGKESWIHSEVEMGGQKIPYYYRDPMNIVRFLLEQRAFRESLVYSPTMEYNEMGERMDGEMHTADWWWETQVCNDT